MRQYLATLHTQPPHHKKRFALLTSAGFTLVIFLIWALVNFGGTTPEVVNGQARSNKEVSPLSSLLGGVMASVRSLSSNFDELKQGLEVVNFEAQNQNGR